jgi:Asp/Glu/hydantoin racemase
MPETRARIRVVNPNSNEAVTSGIDAALEFLRFADGPEIVCSTLEQGPFGIETQADVESVTMPLRRLVEADNQSDAFVIACYSDPGLQLCREGTARPVFGIAYLRQMGLLDRFAGERPLEMSVAESAGSGTLERLVEVGRELAQRDGAEAVILGCAGMARHRRPLEDALGVPVIDPTQAAVTMALGAVQLARI